MATRERKEPKAPFTFKLPLSLGDELDAYVAAAKAQDRKHGRHMTTRSKVAEQALRDYLKKHTRDRRG